MPPVRLASVWTTSLGRPVVPDVSRAHSVSHCAPRSIFDGLPRFPDVIVRAGGVKYATPACNPIEFDQGCNGSQLARGRHHDGSPAELIAPAVKHRACDEMVPGDVRFRATDKPPNKSAIRFEDVP